MIQGIGVDIIETHRFQQSIDRFGDRLTRKLFTDDEISFCSKQSEPVHHFASLFSAKEALSKALASGAPGDFEWKNVQVNYPSQGIPFFTFFNKTSGRLHGQMVSLSLSYSEINVVALVIIQKNITEKPVPFAVSGKHSSVIG